MCEVKSFLIFSKRARQKRNMKNFLTLKSSEKVLEKNDKERALSRRSKLLAQWMRELQRKFFFPLMKVFKMMDGTKLKKISALASLQRWCGSVSGEKSLQRESRRCSKCHNPVRVALSQLCHMVTSSFCVNIVLLFLCAKNVCYSRLSTSNSNHQR